MTQRHFNLDADLLVKLNQVLRGTALYFATRWSTNRRQFRQLDSWIRMRLRAMKLRRKCYNDNWRLPNAKFAKLGLLSLESFCWS